MCKQSSECESEVQMLKGSIPMVVKVVLHLIASALSNGISKGEGQVAYPPIPIPILSSTQLES